MDQPIARFRILNEFLGNRNPNARIWFIGLEEAYEWKPDPEQDAELYRDYAKRFSHAEPGRISADARRYGRRYTKVYDMMSKLIVGALGPACTLDWKTYRDERLFVVGSEAFQMNLYPLGERSLKRWPPWYEALFGFPSPKAYREAVRTTRFPLLRDAHRRYAPILTICFGKSGWDDFEEVLGLGNRYEVTTDGRRIYPSRVVLTPFFSYRFMSNQRVVALAERLARVYASVSAAPG